MKQQRTPFLKELANIHFYVCAAAVLFLVLVVARVYLLPHKSSYTGSHTDLPLILSIIGYGVSCMCLMYGVGVFEQNMRNSKQYSFVREKMLIFRKAYYIRLVLHTAPTLLTTVLFLLTADYYFLIATAVCIYMLVTARPTLDFIAYKLYFKDEEQEALKAHFNQPL